MATFPPRRGLIPLDETYMQYLERLKATCPDRGPHATELLEMIASGKGSWEAGWRSINTEASKNLYCPICFKCVFRVIPDRHPNCWCQNKISSFFKTPSRDKKKGGMHLCPICVSGHEFGSAKKVLVHMADKHSVANLKKHHWNLWILLRVNPCVWDHRRAQLKFYH